MEGSALPPLTFPGLFINIEPGTRLGSAFEGAGMARTYDYNWGPNFSAGGYHQAYVEVTWELTDPVAGKRLFRTGTTGFKRQDEHSAGVFRKAFNLALMNLLADEDFVAAAAGG